MSLQLNRTEKATLDFGLRTSDWRVIAIGFAVMLAIVVPVGYIFGAIKPHLPDLALHTWNGWLRLVKEPLETSLFEELLFRAALFGWLARHWHVEAAALFSTAIFALLHFPGGVAMIFFAFVLGYILAKAYAATGRIMVPIFIHYLVIVAGMFLLRG
jgi:membrane protease YdiL (CAAX protease family)